jgi:hypothetical protein
MVTDLKTYQNESLSIFHIYLVNVFLTHPCIYHKAKKGTPEDEISKAAIR